MCLSTDTIRLLVLKIALASFDVLVGQHAAADVTGLDAFTLCHDYSGSTQAGATETIDCDDDSLQGRYVAIIRRASDVTLHFCEIEIVGVPGKSDFNVC